jgi:hypothetical protein
MCEEVSGKEKRRRRRNDRERMKAKARKVGQGLFPKGMTILNTARNQVSRDQWIEEYACRAADNLAKCSCEMCRNPRRSVYSSKGKERLTMQEKRQPKADDWEG